MGSMGCKQELDATVFSSGMRSGGQYRIKRSTTRHTSDVRRPCRCSRSRCYAPWDAVQCRQKGTRWRCGLSGTRYMHLHSLGPAATPPVRSVPVFSFASAWLWHWLAGYRKLVPPVLPACIHTPCPYGAGVLAIQVERNGNTISRVPPHRHSARCPLARCCPSIGELPHGICPPLIPSQSSVIHPACQPPPNPIAGRILCHTLPSAPTPSAPRPGPWRLARPCPSPKHHGRPHPDAPRGLGRRHS